MHMCGSRPVVASIGPVRAALGQAHTRFTGRLSGTDGKACSALVPYASPRSPDQKRTMLISNSQRRLKHEQYEHTETRSAPSPIVALYSLMPLTREPCRCMARCLQARPAPDTAPAMVMEAGGRWSGTIEQCRPGPTRPVVEFRRAELALGIDTVIRRAPDRSRRGVASQRW